MFNLSSAVVGHWYYWQYQVRWVDVTVANSLPGLAQLGIFPCGFPRIVIAVKTRKIGRRDLNTNPMSTPKHIPRHTYFDLLSVNLIGLQQDRITSVLT